MREDSCRLLERDWYGSLSDFLPASPLACLRRFRRYILSGKHSRSLIEQFLRIGISDDGNEKFGAGKLGEEEFEFRVSVSELLERVIRAVREGKRIGNGSGSGSGSERLNLLVDQAAQMKLVILLHDLGENATTNIGNSTANAAHTAISSDYNVERRWLDSLPLSIHSAANDFLLQQRIIIDFEGPIQLNRTANDMLSGLVVDREKMNFNWSIARNPRNDLTCDEVPRNGHEIMQSHSAVSSADVMYIFQNVVASAGGISNTKQFGSSFDISLSREAENFDLQSMDFAITERRNENVNEDSCMVEQNYDTSKASEFESATIQKSLSISQERESVEYRIYNCVLSSSRSGFGISFDALCEALHEPDNVEGLEDSIILETLTRLISSHQIYEIMMWNDLQYAIPEHCTGLLLNTPKQPRIPLTSATPMSFPTNPNISPLVPELVIHVWCHLQKEFSTSDSTQILARLVFSYVFRHPGVTMHAIFTFMLQNAIPISISAVRYITQELVDQEYIFRESDTCISASAVRYTVNPCSINFV